MKNPSFENTSPSFKRLNPHLFGAGGLQATDLERTARPALEDKPPRQAESPRRLVPSGPRFRVGIVAFRTKLIDDRDNLTGGLKHLRDAIAEWLGVDDNERFVEWEYSQLRTRGRQQCAVRIERR